MFNNIFKNKSLQKLVECMNINNIFYKIKITLLCSQFKAFKENNRMNNRKIELRGMGHHYY